jgi:hypothetical protein
MKLPKTLYVRVAGEKGDEYLNAAATPGQLMDEGDRGAVGVYVLKETVVAECQKTVTLSKGSK